MLLSGTSAVFQEPAVTVKLPAAVCPSDRENVDDVVEVPALIVRFGTLLIVGGVLTATALTVTVKLVMVLRVPSLTMRSICVVPVCPAAGETVTVRLEPLPPSTMLVSGTSAVFQEPAVTVKLPAAVCP